MKLGFDCASHEMACQVENISLLLLSTGDIKGTYSSISTCSSMLTYFEEYVLKYAS